MSVANRKLQQQVPEGYKQTEVGVIPDDWTVTQVQDVCGFIVPGRNKPRRLDGDIPWITTPDLVDGQTVYRSRSSLKVTKAEAKFVGSKVVPEGSVIMTCVGELGIVALTGCEVVLNQQLHAFLPSEKINSSFLVYALKRQTSYFYTVATKTALPYINKDNCNATPIPLPSLKEQTAIANALSDVDALITSLEKLIVKKRAIKTAAMQQLLTGKKRLPPFDQTHTGYKQTELGEIPEDWEVKLIGNAISIRHGRDQKEVETQGGIYPILGTGGEMGRTDTFLYDKPSVLIGRKGTINRPVYMESPFWTVDTLFYSEVGRQYSAKFIYYKFCMIDWMAYNEASGVPSLNASTIEKIIQSFPVNNEEQVAIASVLSDIDTEINALEQRLSKTQQLKQGMMQELLTGRTRLV